MARKKQNRRSLLLSVVVLVWLAISLAAYYAFHRPFTPQFAFLVLAAGRDLLVSAALFALAGALGTRLLPRLPASPLARWAARGTAGLGGLGLLYLLVGSTLGTGGLLAWGLWAGLAVLLRGEFRLWWADLKDVTMLWRASGKLGRTTAVLIGIIFGCALLITLAPPLQFDALVYHLALPKLYLEQGRVGYVAELTHWGFPQLAHMLMTWAGALGNQHGALIGWDAGLFACIGIVGQVAATMRPRRGWVAASALLCGGSLATSLSSGYVDWPAILMAWAMLLMLELAFMSAQSRRTWLAWAGIFCGLAFGAKYTAGLLAPLGAIAIIWLLKDWRGVARFLIAALLVALPWLVRNVLATGNPFYPLLLPGGEMDGIRLGYYQGFAAQGNWWDAILLPLRATWYGVESGRIGNTPGYETSLGILLLTLGGLAWLPAGESKKARWLKRSSAIITVGGLMFWAVAGRITGHLIRSHLYFFLFPAFAILAAWGFAAGERIRYGELRVGRILGAVIALALGLNALQSLNGLATSRVLEYWAGSISQQAYLETNLGLYSLVMDSLPTQTGGERVLMLWETRGYSCLPACDPDEVIDRWPHDLAIYGAPQAVLEAWREQGFEYVLYYKIGASFIHEDNLHFHPFDIQQVESTLNALPLVRDYNGDYLLFSLEP
jgi:hypothetical protein